MNWKELAVSVLYYINVVFLVLLCDDKSNYVSGKSFKGWRHDN
jgi:hypothetical protein